MEASSDILDKYKCIICQEIFQEPVSLSPCQHTYCKKCIQEYFKKSKEEGQILKYIQ